MKRAAQTQLFQKSRDHQWSIRFTLGPPDRYYFRGVVTHIQPDFVVLLEEDDFAWDTTYVLPRKFIETCRDSAFEATFNAILRRNGLLEKLTVPEWLDTCDTLPSVLAQLKERDIWPAITALEKSGRQSGFYIGPITHIGKNCFSIWCYDATGQWESEYRIRYKDVYLIDIDSRYVQLFNEYMRATNPWETREKPKKKGRVR